MLSAGIDYVLNLNVHLANMVNHYGAWSYAILFFVIFAETGLVIFPFLPGDSLLFAAGIITSQQALGLHTLIILLIIAAILGNVVNYTIGRQIGHLLFKDDNSLIFKKRYLTRSHDFYERYGGKMLVIARFVPLVRTYAPFVAGVSRMHWLHFFWYTCVGAFMWVMLIIYTSHFFGSIPWVKEDFSIAIIIIIILSICLPLLHIAVQWLKIKISARKA
ncbi:MAG: DedA family protein [Gammaproteobacteria bacterium]|nr:DedA family protein [Gammaproteobacteria bacterium]